MGVSERSIRVSLGSYKGGSPDGSWLRSFPRRKHIYEVTEVRKYVENSRKGRMLGVLR